MPPSGPLMMMFLVAFGLSAVEIGMAVGKAENPVRFIGWVGVFIFSFAALTVWMLQR